MTCHPLGVSVLVSRRAQAPPPPADTEPPSEAMAAALAQRLARLLPENVS